MTMSVELLISVPGGRSETVSLEGETLSVGRASDNTLSFPEDPWLSRYHLRFERQGLRWFVTDCGSRNGTVVNTNILNEPHALESGDRIQAGNIEFLVNAPLSVPHIVSFVSGETSSPLRDSTVMTSLDRVLSATVDPGPEDGDSALSSSRAVAALLRAGQELAGHRPLDDLFSLILDLALSAVDAKRGIILTFDGTELAVRASRGQDFTISTAVRDRVLLNRCSLMIEDAQIDDLFRSQHSIVAQRVRSILAVPLQTGQQVIGLLYIDNGELLRPFDQEDLDLLTVLANVAAIRIEHARLAEIEQQEKLTAFELDQARDIQKGLLPASVSEVEGCQLAAANLPCRTVGGDYYDFLPYSDGRVALVIGDVSGKGLPAALMMSSLQARVQMLAETQPDADEAVSILNRNLCARCPAGKFITFFFAVFQPQTGLLSYANAGHNYPLILRADGTVDQLRGSDMVLGIVPGMKYQLRQAYLGPGDLLALYSDGVTEARDHLSNEFGEEGLSRFLQAHQERSLAEIVERLQGCVQQWTDRSLFADDFTVVLIRRNTSSVLI
jgi:phosphoserine phosphatase RsbU/P